MRKLLFWKVYLQEVIEKLEVIKEAYRLGCLYDSWSDQFDNDKWMQAFENTGIDIAFYNLRKGL